MNTGLWRIQAVYWQFFWLRTSCARRMVAGSRWSARL